MASKEEIVKELEASHPALLHEVAAKHQGVLIDLYCKTPNCGKSYPSQWFHRPVHRDAKQEDEFRHLICLNCGTKGNYSWSYHRIPTQDDISRAREKQALIELEKIKNKIKDTDEKIEQLQSFRHSLVEQLNAFTEPKTRERSESRKTRIRN